MLELCQDLYMACFFRLRDPWTKSSLLTLIGNMIEIRDLAGIGFHVAGTGIAMVR